MLEPCACVRACVCTCVFIPVPWSSPGVGPAPAVWTWLCQQTQKSIALRARLADPASMTLKGPSRAQPGLNTLLDFLKGVYTLKFSYSQRIFIII